MRPDISRWHGEDRSLANRCTLGSPHQRSPHRNATVNRSSDDGPRLGIFSPPAAAALLFLVASSSRSLCRPFSHFHVICIAEWRNTFSAPRPTTCDGIRRQNSHRPRSATNHVSKSINRADGDCSRRHTTCYYNNHSPCARIYLSRACIHLNISFLPESVACFVPTSDSADSDEPTHQLISWCTIEAWFD